MAEDPNGIRTDRFFPSVKDWPEGIALPTGVTKDDKTYYLHETVYNDGRRVLEWRKRGTGGTPDKPDDEIVGRVSDVLAPVRDAHNAARAKEPQEGEIRPSTGPTREVHRGGQWVVEPNPTYQTPAAQQEDWHTEGTPDPNAPGGFDNSRPTMVRTVNGQRQTRQPTAKELQDWNQAGQMTRNPGGQTDAEMAAAAERQQAAADKNRPQIVAGTLNTTSPQFAVVDPVTQQVTWQPNPNYQNPSPKPLNIPNTRTIIWDNGDGTTRTEKNPNYQKPSKLVPHPSDPGKWVNVTEDDNGNPVILPVDDKTTIKPADLPVLQSKYGQISQDLGALAQDLNSRVARGEITPLERQQAFTAAYQQAQTQVSELNSILDNSKAIWTGQVTQRGQTLNETQSRRSFADSAANRALDAGMKVAQGALPGNGKAIVRGVEALMRMQERYAGGMGGFRESPEVGLPPALEQARGIGLPGFPMPSGGPSASVPSGVPQPSPPSAASVPPGVPPGVPQPAARPEPLLPPPPPVPGQAPIAGMGAALGAADSFSGSPVAGGGDGMWNPDPTIQGMMGDGSDPDWAEAVKRAAGMFSQAGAGRFGR